MAFLAVDADGTECIYDKIPMRSESFEKLWRRHDRIRDNYVKLPTGSIKKLIGRELTWEDEPVELK